MNRFLQEVLEGLNAKSKHLHSKYFYDESGDKIFQQIMAADEYYLTNCENEIFEEQTSALATTLKNGFNSFDFVELGAGDATKSSHLLKELVAQETDFNYFPIDISSHVIDDLETNLPKSIPSLKVKGFNGEYFEMLEETCNVSKRRKVVLFLGSNIGNMPVTDAKLFCENLRKHLAPTDLVLIGFDLKKNPRVIRAAYNDKDGFTKEFNLNLLRRMNKELGADFDLDAFEHYPSYDPLTGSCKSYLMSLKKQAVAFADIDVIHFEENEAVFMEISQKYSVNETENLAKETGFKPVKHFFDHKNWFLDTVWECV